MPTARGFDPSTFKLGPAAARRLAAMSDLSAESLVGMTVAEIGDKFRFEIEPQLLLFRKVCGEVVKTDPATGIDYPVPFATVQVEDTDCSLLGYFPTSAIWSWFFPFRCSREVIATTKTDACGKFCVWIPRWDIDWVLRFRRQRFCFPIIFERPSLRDLIDVPILREPRLPRPIGPQLDKLESLRFERLQSQVSFGADAEAVDAALDAPALLPNVRPPLPPELKLGATEKKRNIVVQTLAARLHLEAKELQGLDLRRYVGPFKRCFDVIAPEWTPIIDVPDITFRVLQDTNADGVEESIYSESHFDVRWNAGPMAPVVIHASAHAIAAQTCGTTSIPCADKPAIVLAGRLPVTGDSSVYNTSTGYAVRTNRPHPSGSFQEPLPNTSEAASPLMGVLSLFGCHRTDPNATHYRLQYRHSTDHGATFGDERPFLGLTWPLYRLNASGIGEWHWPTADSAGWYPIALPPGPNPWLPQDLLLDWPSKSLGDGLYIVKLELGSGGTVTSSSEPVAFNIDNSTPNAPITVEWSFNAAGPFVPIDVVCPVVRRQASPVDLYFRVTLEAAASHLRSAQLWASGCGAGNFTFVSGSGGQQDPLLPTYYQHWHQNPDDNDQTLRAIYRLPSGAAEGTYSFTAYVVSRAFNPSGYDGGHLKVPAWQYDPDHVHTYSHVAFSVFNA